jgi:hypothetical protein
MGLFQSYEVQIILSAFSKLQILHGSLRGRGPSPGSDSTMVSTYFWSLGQVSSVILEKWLKGQLHYVARADP